MKQDGPGERCGGTLVTHIFGRIGSFLLTFDTDPRALGDGTAFLPSGLKWEHFEDSSLL